SSTPPHSMLCLLTFYSLPPPPPSSPLFPYTTLFRSAPAARLGDRLLHRLHYRGEGDARLHRGDTRLVGLARDRLEAVARESNERSEEHTSELQSLRHLVCRLLLEKKKKTNTRRQYRT